MNRNTFGSKADNGAKLRNEAVLFASLYGKQQKLRSLSCILTNPNLSKCICSLLKVFLQSP